MPPAGVGWERQPTTFAPSRSLFLNDNVMKLRSHLRKGTVDSVGKQTISLHASCSLPPAPAHLSQTVTWDTRLPLPPFSVHPASRGRRWRGGRLGAPARARQQEPRASAPVRPGCPICPCAPGCPSCSPVRHHTCRNVPASVPWCFRAALGCRLLPSSVSLCHTPARSSRSSLWLSLHCFAPSGFLLSESPGELVGASVLFGGPLRPPQAAWPVMLLGRQVTWVTSVNSLRPSLLLPGASCFPSTVPRSQSPSPLPPVAGGPQHSSGFDRNGGPSC